MSNIKLMPTAQLQEALKRAFTNSNIERALNKYINVLESQINSAITRGRSPYEHKLGLFSISLSTLTHKGGQIGPNKVRLHQWLADNGFAMVETVTRGSNLTRQLSHVKLTQRVTIFRLEAERAHASGHHQAVCSECDVSPIAMHSLSQYTAWLQSAQCTLRKRQQERDLTQALDVWHRAQREDGVLVQKKALSPFGRTYYHGVSVQSVSKSLRRAMLGQCWEYDLRSCVVAWKLGFGDRYCAANSHSLTTAQAFPVSLRYVLDKATLIEDIAQAVFDDHSVCDPASQVKLIKQALTAISFGARERVCGWWSQDGTRHHSALASIFNQVEERERFVACGPVSDFIDEQKCLDRFITQSALEADPKLRRNALLLTQKGRLSKPKLMALLYQSAEARLMALINAHLVANHYTVIARIHDAIVVSQPLSDRLRTQLIDSVRAQTDNPYWYLSETAHQPFEFVG